ncbi:hypothetical protein EJ04DRAFT_388750, partial [Polyplosphaeria fusca]
MKALVDRDQTITLLRSWSGAEKPIIASYFYWINGSEMQRSQEGLLRCLLYDYLRQCPIAVANAFPDIWTTRVALVAGPHSQIHWKRKTLLESFTHLTTLDTGSAHLCVFIDGLDEYNGDHQDLIDTVQYMSRLKIKLCVASRPWNVFEKAFGNASKIYMQDLNAGDIQLYVKDKLINRPDFQIMRVASIEMDDIITEICEKSQGVFLWVFLVVRSMIAGLINQDQISLLRKRLHDFPSDLNDFFRQIFDSMDPIYRMKTSHMFQATLFAGHSLLTTLTHWYLDDSDDHPDAALTMKVERGDNAIIKERSEQMGVRINGRCKGLLEMRKTGQYTMRAATPTEQPWQEVDFLHRTVRDFFRTLDM